MNAGDVTMNSTNWVIKNVASECGDQVFASDNAEERSAECCATRLVFHIPRCVNVSVALLHAVLSSNIVYGTNASQQPNASSAAALEYCVSFTFESAVQSVKLQNFDYSELVQSWHERPSAQCAGRLAPVGHARVRMAPTGANKSCWKLPVWRFS